MIPRQQAHALWLILALVGLAIVVVHGAGWYHLTTFRGRLETELGERLLAVTRFVAASFSGDSLDGETSLDVLLSLQKKLEAARLRNSLAALTLLDAEQRILASTSSLMKVGECTSIFDLDGNEMLEAWSGKSAVSRTIRYSEFMLKTAYAPVSTKDGVVVAVLAAEGDHDFLRLISDFEDQLIGAGTIAFMALLLSGIIASLALRRLMEAQEMAMRSDKLATVGKLAAGVTHEIRNPLGTITTTCQLLDKRLSRIDLPAKDNTRKLFGYILDEVDRLNEIVERFVSFARQAPFSLEILSIKTALDKLEGLVTKTLKDKGVTLEIVFPEVEGFIRADSRQLHQVLLNCVLNGADAAVAEEIPVVRVSAITTNSTSGVSWSLVIEDNGPGFSDELGHSIFDPFVTSKPTGTGLGLAVAKEVMDSHGGSIRLARSSLSGARVELVFPPTPDYPTTQSEEKSS